MVVFSIIPVHACCAKVIIKNNRKIYLSLTGNLSRFVSLIGSFGKQFHWDFESMAAVHILSAVEVTEASIRRFNKGFVA